MGKQVKNQPAEISGFITVQGSVTMNIRSVVVGMAALIIWQGAQASTVPQCETNYTQEGKYFSQRRFSTWEIVPNVSPDDAFKRIYLEGTKSGLTVVNSDKEMGIISFEQPGAGQTLGGQTVSVPWTIIIESVEGGLRIGVTKTVPPSYATSKKFQMQTMCQAIWAAKGPA